MNATPSNCRNCGGTERYFQEIGATGAYGPNLLPIGFFTNRKFRIEVCGDCGLVEWFVPARLLPKLKTRFSRLP